MTRYTFLVPITKLENKTEEVWVSGVGPNAVFRTVNLGWFVLFEGSHEMIFLGPDQPKWQVGDKIKITMEKVIAKN